MAYSVITDYSKTGDHELDEFLEYVHQALSPNPNFVFEAGVLTKFKTDADDYRIKLVAAGSNNPLSIIDKNDAKAVAVENLRDIALEVNRQADGVLYKLASSGLTLARIKAPIGLLPKPLRLSVKSGRNSGSLLCSVEANKNALMYNFYTAPVPEPASIIDWRLTPSSKHTANIENFKPGTEYAVKCAYQGTSKELIFSETVYIYAQ